MSRLHVTDIKDKAFVMLADVNKWFSVSFFAVARFCSEVTAGKLESLHFSIHINNGLHKTVYLRSFPEASLCLNTILKAVIVPQQRGRLCGYRHAAAMPQFSDTCHFLKLALKINVKA